MDLLSAIVHDEWGWILRCNDGGSDFGIDAHIDVVSDSGAVTGQCIAVQVKAGPSYFENETSDGFVFRGQRKHLNYYMNCSMPVAIVLCDPTSQTCFWTFFAPAKTHPTRTGWKVSVPKRNVLCAAAKVQFLEAVGPAKDYLPELEQQWKVNEALTRTEYVYYAVSRSNIEEGNVAPIRDFFRRVRGDDFLCRRLQGRVEIGVAGYVGDARELYEIDEVRAWFAAANMVVQDWFFFLRTEPPTFALRLYLFCLCGAGRTGSKDGNVSVPVNLECVASVLERNWGPFNELTDRLGLSAEENARIGRGVIEALGIRGGPGRLRGCLPQSPPRTSGRP